MNYVKTCAIFNLFKIKMSNVFFFGTEKCKVTFGFKYIICISTGFRHKGRTKRAAISGVIARERKHTCTWICALEVSGI